MKIHEFQAKSILSRFGVEVPRGEVASGIVKAAREIGFKITMVVRLERIFVGLGNEILYDSGLGFVSDPGHEGGHRIGMLT